MTLLSQTHKIGNSAHYGVLNMKLWQHIGIDTKWAWGISSLAALVLVLSLKGLYSVWRYQVDVPSMDLNALHANQTPTIAHPALFGHDVSAGLPVSDLKLTVKGIFASNDARKGAAIIAANGRSPKLYEVGDRLPGGATLVEVYSTQIVLEEVGSQTVLKLPEKRL